MRRYAEGPQLPLFKRPFRSSGFRRRLGSEACFRDGGTLCEEMPRAQRSRPVCREDVASCIDFVSGLSRTRFSIYVAPLRAALPCRSDCQTTVPHTTERCFWLVFLGTVCVGSSRRTSNFDTPLYLMLPASAAAAAASAPHPDTGFAPSHSSGGCRQQAEQAPSVG